MKFAHKTRQSLWPARPALRLQQAALCLTLLLGLGLPACRGEGPPQWQLHTVSQGPLSLSLQQTGTLGSAQETAVYAPFDGTLTQLVPEGTVVKKGQLLGRFETTTQQQERDSAQLSLKEAQIDKQLASLEQDWRSQEVRFNGQQAQGQLNLEKLKLRQLKEERDQTALTNTQESLKALEQRKQILELEARERSRLYELGYLSKQERDQARLQLGEAAKEQERLQAELVVLKQGARPQEVKKQQLQVQKAQAHQRQLQQEAKVQSRVAEVMKRSADGRIARYQDRVKYYQGLIQKGSLNAPVAGTVIYGKLQVGEDEVPIKAGDAVKEGVTVLRLVDLQQPVVRTQIHEIDAPRVKVGQQVKISLDAWPELKLTGVVKRILPVASQSQSNDALEIHSFASEIQLQNSDKRLLPGMTANLEIITEQLQNVLTVPSQALVGQQAPELGNAAQSFCWVLSASGKPERRAVVLGPSDARQTVIQSGLQAGDKVILNPSGLEKQLASPVPADQSSEVSESASPTPSATVSDTASEPPAESPGPTDPAAASPGSNTDTRTRRRKAS